MHALITLSHGSRHPRAKRGIEVFTGEAGALLGVPAADAHLEFDTPTLEATARELARAGHTSATVVPLLFTRAFHATVDVPEAVDKAHAHLDLTLAEGLGTGEDIARILEMRVLLDAEPNSHVVLYPVGTSNPEQTRAYEELAERLAGRLQHGAAGVSVVSATRGGIEALREIAQVHERMHLLPLFVTHGTLLDKAYDALPLLAAETGAHITHSAPLLTSLAPVVAERYKSATSLIKEAS
ncbi:hypothetical protein A0K93_02055 [Corynebacterium sp. BCW_4722]|nr:hypothetical protein A0K93_02055 [Corynebacterium sp. BCW_4722]